MEKLAVHLTKNLQVLVRDIHVRYEDSVTRPGITLSAGATLHSLEVKVRLELGREGQSYRGLQHSRLLCRSSIGLFCQS